MGTLDSKGRPLRYSMIIEWSDEDNAYIVTIPEFSGCRTHGATYEQAVKQGQDGIEGWIDAAREGGNPVPPPKAFNYWSPFGEPISLNQFTLSGNDGDDAKPYQERDLREILTRLRDAERRQP